MEEKEKIAVLLAEYNTLRAEVLAARGYVAQSIQIAAVVFMGTLGFVSASSSGDGLYIGKWIAGLDVVYLAVVFLWNEANTRGFTRHIRKLERDINARAAPERLLVWESKEGWGSMIRRVRYPDEPPFTDSPPPSPPLPPLPPAASSSGSSPSS